MKYLPKITEKEARAFLKDADCSAKYPLIYQTISAWIDTKDTPTPCYNIKWNRNR